MPDHVIPEIKRTSLTSVVLTLKCLAIHDVIRYVGRFKKKKEKFIRVKPGYSSKIILYYLTHTSLKIETNLFSRLVFILLAFQLNQKC
jgi:hypothetical protein